MLSSYVSSFLVLWCENRYIYHRYYVSFKENEGVFLNLKLGNTFSCTFVDMFQIWISVRYVVLVFLSVTFLIVEIFFRWWDCAMNQSLCSIPGMYRFLGVHCFDGCHYLLFLLRYQIKASTSSDGELESTQYGQLYRSFL